MDKWFNLVTSCHIETFPVEFTFKDKTYSVEYEHTECDGTTQILWVITKRNGEFALKEMCEISQKFKFLFSFLTGHSLSIRKVFLIASNEQKFPVRFFSDDPRQCKEFPLNTCREALCNVDMIFKPQLWKNIIESFFKNGSFHSDSNSRLVYHGYSSGSCFHIPIPSR